MQEAPKLQRAASPSKSDAGLRGDLAPESHITAHSQGNCEVSVWSQKISVIVWKLLLLPRLCTCRKLVFFMYFSQNNKSQQITHRRHENGVFF